MEQVCSQRSRVRGICLEIYTITANFSKEEKYFEGIDTRRRLWHTAPSLYGKHTQTAVYCRRNFFTGYPYLQSSAGGL